MNKRLSLFYGGLLTALAVVGLGINELRYDKDKDPYKLYPRVLEEADKNKDRNVTESEWLSVYEFLGKPYDARRPSTLTVEEMRKYLNLK